MRISIIIPVYNVEKYLRRCMDSILNQDYKNIEIILINDGSTDKSEYICKEYSERNKNIKFISQNNKGIAETRNIGLKHATGEYVTFLDSDDWVESNIYSILIRTAEEYNSDIVVCGYNKYYEGGRIQSLTPYKEITHFNGKEALAENLKGNITTVLWDKLYRRSLFDGVKIPNIKCFEDQMPNLITLLKSSKVTCIPNKLVYYFYREDSITNTKTVESKLTLFEQLEIMKKFLESNNLYNEYKDYFQYKAINLINFFIISKITTLPLGESMMLYRQNVRSEFKKYSKLYYENRYLSMTYKLRIFLIRNFTTLYFIMIKTNYKVKNKSQK